MGNENNSNAMEGILASLKKLEESFKDSIDKVNSRVEELARSRSRSPSPKRKRLTCSTSKRAGNEPQAHDDSDTEELDLEEKPGASSSEMSEEALEFLKSFFTKTMDSQERKQFREQYPIPGTDLTKTPKLDDIFGASESRFSKNTEARLLEKELSSVQGFMLDVTRPLLHLVEESTFDDVDPTTVHSLAVDALQLLGNAVGHMSKLRRKKVLKICNPDIASLAEKEELFTNAAPALFGEGFEKKIKERSEAVRVLHKSQRTAPPQAKHQPFRGTRPPYPQRGGGYRGRGTRSRTPNYMGYNRYHQEKSLPSRRAENNQ